MSAHRHSAVFILRSVEIHFSSSVDMNKTNLLLLPGLVCDRRLWQNQIAGLADLSDITVGKLTGADTIAGLAAAVIAQAPAGRFALAGLSMGGYVALEIMRQA